MRLEPRRIGKAVRQAEQMIVSAIKIKDVGVHPYKAKMLFPNASSHRLRFRNLYVTSEGVVLPDCKGRQRFLMGLYQYSCKYSPHLENTSGLVAPQSLPLPRTLTLEIGIRQHTNLVSPHTAIKRAAPRNNISNVVLP